MRLEKCVSATVFVETLGLIRHQQLHRVNVCNKNAISNQHVLKCAMNTMAM